MAMSAEDIEAFIQELQRDPQLRDRARNVILADDFLELPKIVARLGTRIEELVEVDRGLGARIDQLTERMDQLVVRMDQLAERMDQLIEQVSQLTVRFDRFVESVNVRFDRLEGQVGNLDGRVFEWGYERKLGTHLARRFRKVRLVGLSDYDPFYRAWKSGVITEDEWEDVARLDIIALGNDTTAPDEPEVVIAMKLSKVVDDRDVGRVHRRAAILARSGVAVIPLVDGESIHLGARALAEARGVIALVQRDAQPA